MSHAQPHRGENQSHSPLRSGWGESSEYVAPPGVPLPEIIDPETGRGTTVEPVPAADTGARSQSWLARSARWIVASLWGLLAMWWTPARSLWSRWISPLLARRDWVIGRSSWLWDWISLKGWSGSRWSTRLWMLGGRLVVASALFGLVVIWWDRPGLWPWPG